MLLHQKGYASEQHIPPQQQNKLIQYKNASRSSVLEYYMHLAYVDPILAKKNPIELHLSSYSQKQIQASIVKKKWTRLYGLNYQEQIVASMTQSC